MDTSNCVYIDETKAKISARLVLICLILIVNSSFPCPLTKSNLPWLNTDTPTDPSSPSRQATFPFRERSDKGRLTTAKGIYIFFFVNEAYVSLVFILFSDTLLRPCPDFLRVTFWNTSQVLPQLRVTLSLDLVMFIHDPNGLCPDNHGVFCIFYNELLYIFFSVVFDFVFDSGGKKSLRFWSKNSSIVMPK